MKWKTICSDGSRVGTITFLLDQKSYTCLEATVENYRINEIAPTWSDYTFRCDRGHATLTLPNNLDPTIMKILGVAEDEIVGQKVLAYYDINQLVGFAPIK